MKPLHLIVYFHAKPGKSEALVASLSTLATATRTEPGCLEYILHKTDDPNHFVLTERWSGREALELHNQTPHLQTAKTQFAELLTQAPQLTFLYEIF